MRVIVGDVRGRGCPEVHNLGRRGRIDLPGRWRRKVHLGRGHNNGLDIGRKRHRLGKLDLRRLDLGRLHLGHRRKLGWRRKLDRRGWRRRRLVERNCIQLVRILELGLIYHSSEHNYQQSENDVDGDGGRSGALAASARIQDAKVAKPHVCGLWVFTAQWLGHFRASFLSRQYVSNGYCGPIVSCKIPDFFLMTSVYGRMLNTESPKTPTNCHLCGIPSL